MGEDYFSPFPAPYPHRPFFLQIKHSRCDRKLTTLARTNKTPALKAILFHEFFTIRFAPVVV